MPEFFLNKQIGWDDVHVDEQLTKENCPYDFIMGVDLCTKLGLNIDFESLTVTWDNVSQPMKMRGELNKQFTKCNDVQMALMAPATSVLEELINDAYQSDHVKKQESRATRILDANYHKADL